MTGLPPAAWHPDPAGRHDQRYWDGARWTEHVRDGVTPGIDPPTQLVAPASEPVAQPAPAPTETAPKQGPGKPPVSGCLVLILFVAFVVWAISSSGGGSSKPKPPPTVGAKGSVRIDAIYWHMKIAAKIKPNDGTREWYVIARVQARSVKTSTVTLPSGMVQLQVANRVYDQDPAGQAIIGARPGSPPALVGNDIQPDEHHDYVVVFRVPGSALRRQPRLRFNEIGFGSTHAYITLPAPLPAL